MTPRTRQDALYEQVARIGKALASPKRLEILDLLAQGEQAVETLAREVAIDIRLASAHLQALKAAQLVQVRREGKRRVYRLSGPDVAPLGVALRQVAQAHLVELREAVQQWASEPRLLTERGREALLAQARRGEVVVLDVRPGSEFDAAHLPHARSMPLAELARRLDELPRGVAIVAYCRGPFCLLADSAVALLRERGFDAHTLADGVSEWAAAGLPVVRPAASGAAVSARPL